MRNNPIGVFDSGVGGLTVIKTMAEQLPGENFIYFGDTAHLPYGSKSPQQLMSYAKYIVEYLLKYKVKAVVVACGTHSSITVPQIHGQYDVPILGVVNPAARAAIRTTHNGKIGVMATQASVNSKSYSRKINELQSQAQVFEVACPRFVPLVESGQLQGTEVSHIVNEYLQPLMQEGVDTIVLGCTHYPFLSAVISECAGSGVTVIDPALETVTELKDYLQKQELLNDARIAPCREFVVSGDDSSFYNVGRLLVGDMITIVGQVEMECQEKQDTIMDEMDINNSGGIK